MTHIGRIAIFAGFIVGSCQFVPVRQSPVAHGSTEDAPHPVKLKNPEVEKILNRSCSDCHSSHASLPWYGHIAPASWLIVRHMDKGIKKLDLAAWDTRKPLHGEMEDICDAVSGRDMPLRSYTWIHPDTKLSDREIDVVCNWADAPAQENAWAR